MKYAARANTKNKFAVAVSELLFNSAKRMIIAIASPSKKTDNFGRIKLDRLKLKFI